MGKDRSGKFHPPKGKPSGAAKNEEEDELGSPVPVRHPNRNTDKRHETFRNQADDQDSRHDPHAFAEATTQVVPTEIAAVMTKETFAEIANYRAEHCITIYLTTHAAGVEVNEQVDRIAFKTMLQEIAGELKNKGLSAAGVETLLAPAYVLHKDEAFWRQLTKGLGVYIADGMCWYIKLPMDPGRDILVNSAFNAKPLLSLFTSKEYFYLLVISKKQAKLFRADTFGMEHVNVPGLSELDSESEHEGEDPTAPTGLRGEKDAVDAEAFGATIKGDQKKKRLANYLEEVDDVIWKEILHDKTAPLMLAGVEYLIPIYKSVTDYKYVCEEILTGSHERDEIPVLYEQAMKKMKSHFQQPLQKAIELYNNQSATALTTSIVDDIIPAVHYSQASHLFVRKDAQLWGTFDEVNNELKLHENQQDDSDDLVNTAIVKAIQTGAEVHVLEKEEMPAESIMAAVLRYQ